MPVMYPNGNEQFHNIVVGITQWDEDVRYAVVYRHSRELLYIMLSSEEMSATVDADYRTREEATIQAIRDRFRDHLSEWEVSLKEDDPTRGERVRIRHETQSGRRRVESGERGTISRVGRVSRLTQKQMVDVTLDIDEHVLSTNIDNIEILLTQEHQQEITNMATMFAVCNQERWEVPWGTIERFTERLGGDVGIWLEKLDSENPLVMSMLRGVFTQPYDDMGENEGNQQ